MRDPRRRVNREPAAWFDCRNVMLQIVDNQATRRLHSNWVGWTRMRGACVRVPKYFRKETTYVQQSGRCMAFPSFLGGCREVAPSCFPHLSEEFAGPRPICESIPRGRADLPQTLLTGAGITRLLRGSFRRISFHTGNRPFGDACCAHHRGWSLSLPAR